MIMENKNDKLANELEKYIQPDEGLVISYPDPAGFNIRINEDINIDDIDFIVEGVVAFMTANDDIDYRYYDMLMARYLIEYFTDIPLPMTEYEGEEIVDYNACYKYAVMLDLEHAIEDSSVYLRGVISTIQLSIWRRLDYIKSIKPYGELMTALGEFYNVLDDLNGIINEEKELDVDKLVDEVNQISSALHELKNGSETDEE